MKLLRVLVLCCVVLALPLQGFAAVSPLLCHLVGQTSAPAQAVPAGHEAHTAHDMHAMHEAHAQHAEPHALSAVADPGHDSVGHGQAHQCSHCAQCGAAHAMACSTPRVLGSLPHAALQRVAHSPLFSDAWLHPLERPPRPHFA